MLVNYFWKKMRNLNINIRLYSFLNDISFAHFYGDTILASEIIHNFQNNSA